MQVAEDVSTQHKTTDDPQVTSVDKMEGEAGVEWGRKGRMGRGGVVEREGGEGMGRGSL